MAVLGVKMARRLVETEAVQNQGPVEVAPGPAVVADEQIEEALRRETARSSNAHPCCTSALGPEKEGGVVDDKLRVYGVGNLRVVDASIMPLLPVAHLQSTMYAIGEKAAVLIKAD